MNAVDLLAAILRGDATEWVGGGADAEDAFLAAAADHRVEALTAWRLWRVGAFDRWPFRIRTELTRIAQNEALLEAALKEHVRGVIAALAGAGVPCLLVKGAALAYSRYAEPWLRCARNDHDVLVRESDSGSAGRVLAELGYEAANALQGGLVSYQVPYHRVDAAGLCHVVDLHWKISNRPLFADVMSFDELWAESIAVAALGPAARALGDIHELMLACVHPVAHHHNAGDLLWTYDIHLLASRLRPAQFDAFTALARDRKVAAICASSLTRAVEWLHTLVPSGTMAALAVSGEASEYFLSAAAWRGDVRLSDLRLLPGWRAKLQLIREVALPRREYMLKEYDASSRLLIPALHVHRLARGTWRLLRRFAH